MSTMEMSPARTEHWVDGKRYLWLLSPALPLFGLLSVLAVANGAHGAWLFTLPVIFYVIAPLADWLIGEDRINAPETAVTALDEDRYYRWIVFAFIPLQYATTILATWLALTADLAGWEVLGALLASGLTSGLAINTAHELGHKTNGLERWLAKLTLAPVAYGHFFIEHNKGHHKNVATPEDPASSKMGESFYAFWPRTVVGSLKSAWQIEAARLQRLGKPVLSVENENLQAWAMTVVLFAALSLWLGPWALLFLVVQAVIGFSLLEVVNYLEHYGLCRQKKADGRYERCQPRHSWNSNHVVTNLVLYQLQRHSDHHANPTRRYQALRHFDDSPQLPSGYGAMILVAYLPWLWYRLMDPRVVAHHDGDLSRANLLPARRDALIAKWQRASAPAPAAAGADEVLPGEHSDQAQRHQCPNCQYIYDQSVGCAGEGYPAGTPWAELPREWQCPDCAVREKPDFLPLD